jgi:type II secretory pathway pseudopilin PulG
MTNTAKYTLVVVLFFAAIAIVLVVASMPPGAMEHKQTVADLQIIASAIEAYRQVENSYPPVLANDSSTDLLKHLVAVPKSKAVLEYLPGNCFQEPSKLVDGWGTAIYYRHAGRGVAVIAAGPDRIYRTKDDIVEETTPKEEPAQPAGTKP